MTKFIKKVCILKKIFIYSNKSIEKQCQRHKILFSGKKININEIAEITDLECRCNKKNYLFLIE